MVGFVMVSHSKKLAEGAVDLGLLMAPEVLAEAAGGLPDGDMGTDYERILEAVTRVREQSPDGVLIIADMGSSCMTTEMVLEVLDDPQIVMADCPFAEGAVAAMVTAAGGASLEEVTWSGCLFFVKLWCRTLTKNADDVRVEAERQHQAE